MRVAIATAQVPFVRGGAEILAEGLCHALREAGHTAEIIAIPFKWYPPERILDHMLACRLLDVTESGGRTIDLLIGLKFPAYLLAHPRKVLWFIHQHRAAYDLWDLPHGDIIRSPAGAQIRDVIHCADRKAIAEAKGVFTISGKVSARLKQHLGIDSKPLYTPPAHAAEFYGAEAQGYLFYPSRITPMKRQILVLHALALTRQAVCVRFAGTFDDVGYRDELHHLTASLGLQDRVQWLGHLDESEKRKQYAHSLGVIFTPLDEDYGYVTLEAMLSGKPVITCNDSGGTLEFVTDGENGYVADPLPPSLAEMMDRMWSDQEIARKLGRNGRNRYDREDITWSKVVSELCG